MVYSKDLEGKLPKRMIELEREIKEKYNLMDVVLTKKEINTHSPRSQSIPIKIWDIVKDVFNQPLDHSTAIKENEKYVVFCEVYSPINVSKIDTKLLKKYGVVLIPLKYSLWNEDTFPYRIEVKNPKGKCENG